MIFNKYLVNLMMEMDNKGVITRKSQSVYKSSLGFFLALKWLKSFDLIECDGVNKDRLKRWKLNDRGKKVVFHLKSVRRILLEVKNG